MGKQQRKEKEVKIKLKQPDRSDPTHQTLIKLAEDRGLFKSQPSEKEDAGGLDDEEPVVGRLGDSILWSMSLTMLHFTFDVLVAHQYAMAIEWPALGIRSAKAFPRRFPLPPNNS